MQKEQQRRCNSEESVSRAVHRYRDKRKTWMLCHNGYEEKKNLLLVKTWQYGQVRSYVSQLGQLASFVCRLCVELVNEVSYICFNDTCMTRFSVVRDSERRTFESLFFRRIQIESYTAIQIDYHGLPGLNWVLYACYVLIIIVHYLAYSWA